MQKIGEDDFDRFHFKGKGLRILREPCGPSNSKLGLRAQAEKLSSLASNPVHLQRNDTDCCFANFHLNCIPGKDLTKFGIEINTQPKSVQHPSEERARLPPPNLENFSEISARSSFMVAYPSDRRNSSIAAKNLPGHSLLGEIATARHKKRSKSLHKTKQPLLISSSRECEGGELSNNLLPGVNSLAETNVPYFCTGLIASAALQSATPTAISLAQKKEVVSASAQRKFRVCHYLHRFQQPQTSYLRNGTLPEHLETCYQPITNIYPSVPATVHKVIVAHKLRSGRDNLQDECCPEQNHPKCSLCNCSAVCPAGTTRHRLKKPNSCDCHGYSKSDFPKSTLSATQVVLGTALPKGATYSTLTTFKHINLTNLFLITIMLINLAPIVCGHNVNVNSSDKVASPKQHMHQQYHHHHQHDGSANNIRREMNTRFTSLNNGFTNADGSDVAEGELGESSRRFVGEDILAAGATGDRTENDASSATFVRSGCHSCQMREKVKADNLASIKRHILYRLKLKDVPNITAPVVPREIVEKFYKSHYQHNGVNGDRGRGGGGGSGNGAGDSRTPYSDENVGGGGSGGRYSSTIYDNMQGDDPRAFYDANYDGGDNSDGFGNDFAEPIGGDDDDYEEDFFSVVNSIYVFPTMQHTRHNRKTDILHFPLSSNGHSTVSQATLHIFLRSWSWVRDHYDATISSQPSTGASASSSSSQPQQGPNSMPVNGANRNLDIILKVNCVLRHPNTSYAQKGNEIRQRIPRSNNGVWITLDVTDMVTEWYNNGSMNHGVVIKTKEPWMKQFVVLDDLTTNKTYAPYIEVMTKDNRKRRSKRNTSLNCSETDNEVRCCRYPLEVNFRHFNWEWIIAPQSFNAYFCNGECKLGYLPKYPHTHLMQMSTAPQPCCSPTKMSPVSLLYFNNDHILVMSTIPNMAVEKCSCS